MKTLLGWAGLAALLAASPPAHAHELVCNATVNGGTVAEVDRYPATLHFKFSVVNTHPTEVSVVDWVRDSVVHPERMAVGVGIAVGQSWTREDMFTVASFAACRALAGEGGVACGKDGCVRLDDRFSAGFDLGEAQCTTRVVCRPEVHPPPPPPPPPNCKPTRSLGFWKTHPDAARACMAAGPMDLGFVKLTTVNDLLGLLWGSPERFDRCEKRGDLDTARFLLGRQTAVAICNERILGTAFAALHEALDALAGLDCRDIRGLTERVTKFNESGEKCELPEALRGSKANPMEARMLAHDVTAPSHHSCVCKPKPHDDDGHRCKGDDEDKDHCEGEHRGHDDCKDDGHGGHGGHDDCRDDGHGGHDDCRDDGHGDHGGCKDDGHGDHGDDDHCGGDDDDHGGHDDHGDHDGGHGHEGGHDDHGYGH